MIEHSARRLYSIGSLVCHGLVVSVTPYIILCNHIHHGSAKGIRSILVPMPMKPPGRIWVEKICLDILRKGLNRDHGASEVI